MNSGSIGPLIDGATALCFIVGDPISQVKTPQRFNAYFGRACVGAVMAPLHVAAGQLDDAVRGLRACRNLRALVVTVPHKIAMLGHCDEVSERARQVGAVNAIRVAPDGRWSGEIYDGVGFVRGLIAKGNRLRDRRVFVAGAGGAGRALAFEIAAAGASSVTICDLRPELAEALASRLAERFGDVSVRAGAAPGEQDEVLVNCTPLGMQPDDPLPLPLESLQAGRLVADIVMKPERTRLLATAAERGCRTQAGKWTLEYQLDPMLEFFGLDRPEFGPAIVPDPASVGN